MEDEGIVFKPSVEIGKDVTASELMDSCDAVLLACGSTTPRDLPIPGQYLSVPVCQP